MGTDTDIHTMGQGISVDLLDPQIAKVCAETLEQKLAMMTGRLPDRMPK